MTFKYNRRIHGIHEGVCWGAPGGVLATQQALVDDKNCVFCFLFRIIMEEFREFRSSNYFVSLGGERMPFKIAAIN